MLVDVYADEGISGTSVKKRKEFLRMMEDCEAGKVDYIMAKSISRFARNTVECLSLLSLPKLEQMICFMSFTNKNRAARESRPYHVRVS